MWETLYKETITKLDKFKNRYCEYDKKINDKDKELEDIKKQLHDRNVELRKVDLMFKN